jgi:membrane protease YdiL (CAAX protease family)
MFAAIAGVAVTTAIVFAFARSRIFTPRRRAFAHPLGETALALLIVVSGLTLALVAALLTARPADAVGATARQVAISAIAVARVFAYVAFVSRDRRDLGLDGDAARATLFGAVLGIGWLVAGGKAPSLAALTGPQVAALGSFASVGFAEEIAFRGFLQPRAIAAFGPRAGIAGTALCFAILHLPQRLLTGVASADVAPQLVSVFVIGLVLGAVRRVAGNVVSSALLHTAIDWGERL